MNSNNALITELNRKIDHYLEQEQYDEAEDACRDLCRLQGLKPAKDMPEDFLYQLKRKEHETMHRKKTTKRISGIAAAASIAVLLIGGTASAAVIYNNNIHFSIKGFVSGEDIKTSYRSESGKTTAIDLPEMSGEEDTITAISEETGSASTPWLGKKVWDDTYAVWDSDDAVNWTKGYRTTRVTEYKYADYFAAADDAGFNRLFKTNYTGDVFYYENEHLPDESDKAAGIGSATDYNISGEFSYGNGSFSVNQSKNRVGEAGEISKAATMVITTTDETDNEREYLNAAGISFKLSDDTTSGDARTTTMFTDGQYETILQFTGMSEEEIREVLDNICG